MNIEVETNQRVTSCRVYLAEEQPISTENEPIKQYEQVMNENTTKLRNTTN